jgi:hypothetical protein
VSALGCKPQGDCATNAAASTCYERDFAGKSEVHGSFILASQESCWPADAGCGAI